MNFFKTAIIISPLIIIISCTFFKGNTSVIPSDLLLPPTDPNKYVSEAEEKYILRSDGTLRISIWENDTLCKVLFIYPDGQILEREICNKKKYNNSKISVELIRDKEIERVPLVGIKNSDEEPYVIGPEDVINVSVWKDPSLSSTVLVRPDGMISLPLIDDIKAAGYTPQQLKEEITEKLKEFIEYPTVNVAVSSINSYKVYIFGQVNRPGIIPLKDKTTLSQAIILAGGLTEFAKSKKIFILRRYGEKEIKIPVNYKKIIEGKDVSQDILLKKGDTIIVP